MQPAQTGPLPPHLDWQPIRWIPIGAAVEVCDACGFIRTAVLARVGVPLQVFGGVLDGPPTHWRWRCEAGASSGEGNRTASPDAEGAKAAARGRQETTSR